MPGFNIHIAVANEYIKKNNQKNKKEFLKGVVYPDLCIDKSKSHFSGPIYKDNLIMSLQNKINIKDFISCTDLTNNFNKGVFLHLLTDYYFYNYFFDKNYLMNVSWDKFKNDLYYSLDKSDLYVKRKYKVKYKVYKKEILSDLNQYKEYRYPDDSENIINIDKLNKFISEISSINLNNIQESILKGNNI